jgi:hypothetical protein
LPIISSKAFIEGYRLLLLGRYLKNRYFIRAAITRTRTITPSRPNAPIPHIMSCISITPSLQLER